MIRFFSASLAGLLLAALFFALVFLNNTTLGGYRLDLTENQVYSLSEGSKQVIDEIEEPINLYLFYSDTSSKGMTSLRNYANRVESLLEEYALYGNGKINLQVIDPKPFSESEDLATQYGLTGAPVGPIGESIYFGLAGTNALDGQEIIGFFDPQKERFLEYDISQLVHKLSDPEPIQVTVLTDLAVSGGQNPMTGQFEQPMVFYTQLEQLFNVKKLDSQATEIPSETDVLVIAHPKNLAESLIGSIDSFAQEGGRLLLIVDPHYESDPMAMMGAMGANASDFPILSEWGIDFESQSIVLDASLGLEVRTPEGGIARHLGILGYSGAQLDDNDVLTANLESINASSSGHIKLLASSELTIEPLIQSSPNSTLFDASNYAMTQNPQEFARGFSADSNQYTLAARLSGSLNMIVMADADLLSDRFWVQQSNFFGQTIFTPFASNGDFIINAVENLAGSDALISVRSRGTFVRPFERVKELEIIAEEQFRQQEEILQQQLAETENQLAQLQSQQGEGGALVVSPEQQLAIDKFMEQRFEIRKSLREVRYQLESDINELGNWLKIINIAVAPILLSLMLYLLSRLLRRKAPKLSKAN